MVLNENHLNPCFCIPLRAGTIILSVFDMLYGVAYIFRVMYIEYLHDSFYEYFPEDIPNPTKSKFMFYMQRRGNYILTIICGLCLLLATNYLKYYYFWLAVTCYCWLVLKTFLVISYSIFCNALLESEQPHFRRFGFEILFCIFTTIYCMAVVASYVRDTRIELNNYRAIKPINIEQGEHEDYLRNDMESKFVGATSYHFLSPDFFLNSKKNEPESQSWFNLHDTHIDDSLLQYVVSTSVVEVEPEEIVEEEVDEELGKGSVLTIKSKPTESIMTMVGGESKSLMPSEMSMPADWDRDFENFEEGHGYDRHMFSKSEALPKFSSVLKPSTASRKPSIIKRKTSFVIDVEADSKTNLGPTVADSQAKLNSAIKSQTPGVPGDKKVVTIKSSPTTGQPTLKKK